MTIWLKPVGLKVGLLFIFRYGLTLETARVAISIWLAKKLHLEITKKGVTIW